MYRLSRAALGLIAVMIIAPLGVPAAPAAVSDPISVSGIELDATQFAVAMNRSGDRSLLAYAGPVTNSRGARTMLFAPARQANGDTLHRVRLASYRR